MNGVRAAISCMGGTHCYAHVTCQKSSFKQPVQCQHKLRSMSPYVCFDVILYRQRTLLKKSSRSTASAAQRLFYSGEAMHAATTCTDADALYEILEASFGGEDRWHPTGYRTAAPSVPCCARFICCSCRNQQSALSMSHTVPIASYMLCSWRMEPAGCLLHVCQQ
jgi:hypothetical protein